MTEEKKEKYIKQAYQFYGNMGYIPSANDYRIIPDTPSINTIRKYFGSWGKYIEACEFTEMNKIKKETESVYLGFDGWMTDNYKQYFENLFLHVKHILEEYVEHVLYKIVHNQLVYVFTYEKKHYAVCFFNRYVDEYADKMNIIKEVVKDLDMILINLNKSGRWYEKHIRDIFT